MSNVKFIFENAVDDAVLTDSGNIVSTLPVGNLKKSPRTKVVRTTNLATTYFYLDWGGDNKKIGGTGLMRHNLSDAATWQVILYSAANWTGVIYDSGSVAAAPPVDVSDIDYGVDPTGSTVFTDWPQEDKFSTLWFSQLDTVKSARITLTDPTNPDGYLQAGRLFMGVQATPAINAQVGLGNAWREDTKQVRSEGGSLRSDSKPQFRQIKVSLGELTQGERAGFFESVRKMGKSVDFLASIFPDEGGAIERDYTIQCKFATMPEFIYWAQDTYRLTFDLVEA